MHDTYQLDIDSYPVFVRLGYFEAERLAGQEVLVTICAKVAIEGSFVPESLEAIVDYGAVMETVDVVLRGKSIKLIETAVHRVGTQILDGFPPVRWCRVTIHKPILPRGIAKGARVSVTATFTRDPKDVRNV